jgi:hypothetical protein
VCLYLEQKRDCSSRPSSIVIQHHGCFFVHSRGLRRVNRKSRSRFHSFDHPSLFSYPGPTGANRKSRNWVHSFKFPSLFLNQLHSRQPNSLPRVLLFCAERNAESIQVNHLSSTNTKGHRSDIRACRYKSSYTPQRTLTHNLLRLLPHRKHGHSPQMAPRNSFQRPKSL